MALRVNLANISQYQYLQKLRDQGIEAEAVSFCRSAILLNKPAVVDILPGFSEGWVSVQDISQAD